SDHDVAGGNDAGAATVAGALHQRDRRHRQQIEPLHHFSGHARDAQIVFGRGAAHGVKPIDVGAGDEIAAVAGYHHRAQRFTSERIIDLEQRRDHLAVIDVVDLRPVERDARDTALVQAPEHRTGCRRFIHLPYPLTMRTMPQRCTVARSSEPNTRRSNTKPMAPITTRAASMTSVLRNSLASKITQPNPQSEAAIISAPTTAIQARRNACRMPVMMNGEAPGMITFQNREFSSAPMAPAARSQIGLTERTPDQVLNSIGKVAA